MAGFGNTFKKDLQQFIFRGTALPNSIAQFYVGLHTGDPGPDGQTANEVVTTGGTLYARVNKPQGTTDWSTATTANPSVISNATAISFPTAGANWGVITYFSIWRATTGSSAITDFIGGQSLTASQTVNTGNTASFAIGALVHNFTG